jgi:hypothetical protein
VSLGTVERAEVAVADVGVDEPVKDLDRIALIGVLDGGRYVETLSLSGGEGLRAPVLDPLGDDYSADREADQVVVADHVTERTRVVEVDGDGPSVILADGRRDRAGGDAVASGEVGIFVGCKHRFSFSSASVPRGAGEPSLARSISIR